MSVHILAQIHWHTKSEKLCKKSLNDFEAAIGRQLLSLNIEPYWKVKEHMVATFHISVASISNADKVYEMLGFANTLTSSISGDWIFMGPHENNELEFECIFNARRPEGSLCWAHLQLGMV